MPFPPLMQVFDSEGNLCCQLCKKRFETGDLYLIVRQFHDVDADTELAVHQMCLEGIRGSWT